MERRGKEQLKVAILLCSSKEVDFEVFISVWTLTIPYKTNKSFKLIIQIHQSAGSFLRGQIEMNINFLDAKQIFDYFVLPSSEF